MYVLRVRSYHRINSNDSNNNNNNNNYVQSSSIPHTFFLLKVSKTHWF